MAGYGVQFTLRPGDPLLVLPWIMPNYFRIVYGGSK